MPREIVGTEVTLAGGAGQVQTNTGAGAAPSFDGAQPAQPQPQVDPSLPPEFNTQGLPGGADKRVKGALAKFQAEAKARAEAEAKAARIEQEFMQLKAKVGGMESALSRQQAQPPAPQRKQWEPPAPPEGLKVEPEVKNALDYIMQVMESRNQYDREQLNEHLQARFGELEPIKGSVQQMRDAQIVRDVHAQVDARVATYPAEQRDFVKKQLLRGVQTAFAGHQSPDLVTMDEVGKVIDADLAEISKFLPKPAPVSKGPFDGLDGRNPSGAQFRGVPGQHRTDAPDLPLPNSLDELMSRTTDWMRGVTTQDGWANRL
jgi:hypothetical protein